MQGRQAGPRLTACAVALGVLLSQPGHALGYLASYGWRSFALQSQGAHAYFPATFNLSFELLASLALAVLAVLGVGRLALGRALGLRRRARVRPHELVFVLAVVQVNVFLFQEVAEAVSAGLPADGHWLIHTLVLAAAGQVPVALVAGMLLAWCSTGLHAAVEALRSSSVLVLVPAPIAGPRADLGRALPATPHGCLFRRAAPKRGPPRSP